MAKNIDDKAKSTSQKPYAVAKYVRISPTKVRIVIDKVRGLSVNEALARLKFINKAASSVVFKLIYSAASNAVNYDISELYVKEIFADVGPCMKRTMPRAKGRAYRILKRSSHITVRLDVKGEAL